MGTIDYFGARQDVANQRNWDYIKKIQDRNRQRTLDVIATYEEPKHPTRERGYINRKWTKDDQLTVINMHVRGYSNIQIAQYLERDVGRVFDILQPLIIKRAIGYTGEQLVNQKPNYKKVHLYPNVYTIVPYVLERGKSPDEWCQLLGISPIIYCRMLGQATGSIKSVPAPAGINLATMIRINVDELFTIKPVKSNK